MEQFIDTNKGKKNGLKLITKERQNKILTFLLIITTIGIFGLFTSSVEVTSKQSMYGRQLTADWDDEENFQSLKKELETKCSQYVMIETFPINDTLSLQKINPTDVANWVKTPRSDNDLNAVFDASSKKCALLSDTNIPPQAFRYFMVKYLIVPVNNSKAVLEQYQTQIKNNALKTEQKNVAGVQYLIFELSKPLSVSKDGFWNGGRKDDLANQHYFSQLLNDRLIDLYTKEKASKIIDFGCGLCHYVANLKKAGFNAFGYDGNPFTKQISEGVGNVLNLIEPQDVGKADWVESFEVGEHIPPQKTDIFVRNLATHAQKGIVLSWGINGQWGYGHINNKDNIQVIDLLKPYGFRVDAQKTMEIRNHNEMKHFKQSLLVFRKQQLSALNWNNKYSFESLKKELETKCSQYVMIETFPINDTLSLQKINPTDVANWVKTPRSDNDLNAVFDASSKKCALLSDTNIPPQAFRYFMVKYLIVPVNNSKAVLEQYQTQIKNNALKTEQKNVAGVQYLIFELSKPLSVSKDGFWNGGRKSDLDPQHYFSKLLNDRLIELYKNEKPSKIIDFGCGLCHYVANLKKEGFNAFGYDGNPFTKQISDGVGDVLNLIQPQDVGKADWVESFEVGEHIPQQKTDIFVRNLATHAEKGIVISWGISGQWGYGHVNNKDNIQVIQLFRPYGFQIDSNKTIQIRNHPQMRHFQQSLMVFRKQKQ